MDQEQREAIKEEFIKLDALRLDHAKLSAKVDYVEHELRATKADSSNRFERIESKIDSLFERFDSVSGEVKVMGIKIGVGTVAVAMAAQIALKHFGLI